MNWGDFKKMAESQGMVDETEIDVISTSGNFTDNWQLMVGIGKDGKGSIYAYDQSSRPHGDIIVSIDSLVAKAYQRRGELYRAINKTIPPDIKV